MTIFPKPTSSAFGPRQLAVRRRAQRGGALLAVLWLSAALAAIGFAVATRVRAETDHVSTEAEGLRAHYLATGSVERAIQWMIWGPGGGTNGTPRFWRENQPRLYMSYPSGDVVVEMIPESARVSVNYASGDELMRAIVPVTRNLEQAGAITRAILDWRGGGGSRQLGGGAGPTAGDAGTLSGYYSELGPTFQPPHASFREIEELLFVRGITPELFYGNFIPDGAGQLYPAGGLRDALSVWGSAGGPYNVNAASPAVLEGAGLSPTAIQWILERRQVAPIEQVSEIPGVGAAASRLTTYGIRVWTLRASARLRRPDGAPSDVVRTASATVKYFQDPQHAVMPVHVLRFNGNDWSQFAVLPPAGPIPGGLPQ